MRTSISKFFILSVMVVLAAALANISLATADSFTIGNFHADGLGADPNFPNPQLQDSPKGYDILNEIGQINAVYILGEKVKLADVSFTTGYNRWSSTSFAGALDPFTVTLDGTQYQSSLTYSGDISYTDDITIQSAVMTGLGSYKNITLTINGLSFYGDGTQELLGTFTQSSPSPIPEPGSLLLFGTGIAGISFAAWRKRK
jgi:hypothetical protein